ncbi:hypothetical protein [Hymenobacter siberiensis]|jgi:hypothetical protein|uniref:hypothetical protein n=1 Tax=Hymenobacter siberiensis TaxID=2848396 RepID=UPI001C1E6299|nr:hypothetical protein [Hymenobacter siberiensis]
MKTALLSSAVFSPLSPTAGPVREALRVLHRVNPALSWTGWANVALAVLPWRYCSSTTAWWPAHRSGSSR